MTMQPFLESFSNRPLMIASDSGDFFQAAIQFIVNHDHADDFLMSSMEDDEDDFWDEDNWMAAFRPYIVKDGVLQIPVSGVLLNRFPYQLGRWATGYDYIERAVARGIADPEVYAIALVCDSGGGEVAGCFELVDKLYEWGSEKPIRAFSADAAYSAAYAIASVGGEIAVTRSGGTGSIGVVTAHFDFSKALDSYGVKVTFIFAGKHKVDGNRFEELPKDVQARIQKRVDKTYSVFVSTVARNRGMDEDAIRDTQALTYDAEDSVEIGLADRVGALEDEMIAFTHWVAEAKDTQMTTKAKTPAAAATEDMIEQAAHEAAVASAKADGITEGSANEKARMSAILDSDEGKARPKAALSAALKTDMTAEQATAFLADLPEEKAEAPAPAPKTDDTPKAKTPGNPFDNAMSNSDQPNVGADAGSDDEEDGDKASTILADFSSFTGRKKKTA